MKKELKNMSEGDLKIRLKELEQERLKMDVGRATGTTPKSPGHVKVVRKTIARINTLLHQRQTGVEKPTEEHKQ
jgi:large subunit ribosomal protein L29